MDASEFLKKITPAGKRSRLAPYWEDIQKLRLSGCTLEQVCEFLAANGVQMSIAGLSKYIKRREEKSSLTTTPQPSKAQQEEPAKNTQDVKNFSDGTVSTAPTPQNSVDLINKNSLPGFGKPKVKKPNI